jgi:predicted metal-dependent phosphoesterase TrpH
MTNYPCDLHCHTNRSDGSESPKDFLDRASARGMKAVAITDHDIMPPKEVVCEGQSLDIVAYACSKGVVLLPGVEFSCDTQTEDVHIVAFGCDFTDERFKAMETKIKKSKVESYQKLVNIMARKGLPITWEALLASSEKPLKESEIQKKMIFQFIADQGIVPTWRDAKNMVQMDPDYAVYREKPAPETVIKLIKETGGTSILAHPFLINHASLLREDYIKKLVDAGLDGIEAAYNYSKTNYRGDLSDREIELIVRSTYEPMGLMISGGSDYHGEWKKGMANPREIGDAGVTLEAFKEMKIYEYVKRECGA